METPVAGRTPVVEGTGFLLPKHRVVYTLELALYFQLLFFLIWNNRLNPLLGLFPTFRA